MGKSALIVIDVQSYFFDPKCELCIPRYKTVLGKILKLIDFAKENGMPIFYTRHIDIAGNPMENWWGHRMRRGDKFNQLFIESGGGIVIEKSGYDAFLATDLEDRLKQNKIRQLVVCGVMTHLCVDTTVRFAFGRGFSVFVPRDAVASRNPKLHRASLAVLGHGFATITTTEGVKKCIAMM